MRQWKRERGSEEVSERDRERVSESVWEAAGQRIETAHGETWDEFTRGSYHTAAAALITTPDDIQVSNLAPWN